MAPWKICALCYVFAHEAIWVDKHHLVMSPNDTQQGHKHL